MRTAGNWSYRCAWKYSILKVALINSKYFKICPKKQKSEKNVHQINELFVYVFQINPPGYSHCHLFRLQFVLCGAVTSVISPREIELREDERRIISYPGRQWWMTDNVDWIIVDYRNTNTPNLAFSPLLAMNYKRCWWWLFDLIYIYIFFKFSLA